jgi:hypothetical protein
VFLDELKKFYYVSAIRAAATVTANEPRETVKAEEPE